MTRTSFCLAPPVVMADVISSQPKGFIVPQLPGNVQAIDQLSIDKVGLLPPPPCPRPPVGVSG